jgi:hypothetical protein
MQQQQRPLCAGESSRSKSMKTENVNDAALDREVAYLTAMAEATAAAIDLLAGHIPKGRTRLTAAANTVARLEVGQDALLSDYIAAFDACTALAMSSASRLLFEAEAMRPLRKARRARKG